MTAVLLAWDAAVTLTASWQKVFTSDPTLGFFRPSATASRRRWTTGRSSRPRKDMGDMQAVVTNSTVDGILAALCGADHRRDPRRLADLDPGDPHPAAAADDGAEFVESQIEAPSGLLAGVGSR